MRRMKARKRYEWRSRTSFRLQRFLASIARETVAAACSNWLVATAGSMSNFSACWIARRPISSAASRTTGLILRPRRSTGLMWKLRSDGCPPPPMTIGPQAWMYRLAFDQARPSACSRRYISTSLVTFAISARIQGRFWPLSTQSTYFGKTSIEPEKKLCRKNSCAYPNE